MKNSTKNLYMPFPQIQFYHSPHWLHHPCALLWMCPLCLTPCDPMDHSPPDSSVRGIFQTRILGSVAISSSRGSSWPRVRTHISCIGGQILCYWATWRHSKWGCAVLCCVKLLQSCPTLCDSRDCSPPGLLCPWDYPGKNTRVGCYFFLQGIFPTQGSNPSLMFPALAAGSLPLAPPGKLFEGVHLF